MLQVVVKRTSAFRMFEPQARLAPAYCRQQVAVAGQLVRIDNGIFSAQGQLLAVKVESPRADDVSCSVLDSHFGTEGFRLQPWSHNMSADNPVSLTCHRCMGMCESRDSVGRQEAGGF